MTVTMCRCHAQIQVNSMMRFFEKICRVPAYIHTQLTYPCIEQLTSEQLTSLNHIVANEQSSETNITAASSL